MCIRVARQVLKSKKAKIYKEISKWQFQKEKLPVRSVVSAKQPTAMRAFRQLTAPTVLLP